VSRLRAAGALRIVGRGLAFVTGDMHQQSLPDAHIVRHGGARFAPPREPLGTHLRRIAEPFRIALGYALAFMPLTVVLLACAAMIWAAGVHASP